MTAMLLTGMSGAGKSTVLAGLARRGWETVDSDQGGWIEIVAGEPLWRIERIDALLDHRRSVPLVVAGAVANQGLRRGRFDAVVLLTAPLGVLLDRVSSRAPGEYGSSEEDRTRIARDVAEVEPLLRASATHVVDSTAPVVQVVDAVAAVLAPG